MHAVADLFGIYTNASLCTGKISDAKAHEIKTLCLKGNRVFFFFFFFFFINDVIIP